MSARARACVLLATLAAYAPVLLAGGFTGDDFVHVAFGRSLADIDSFAHGAFGPFLGVVPTYLRPVTTLSLAIEGRLFGTSPFPYLLVGVLLHAAASVVVGLIAVRIARRIRASEEVERRVGLAAALLFSASPSLVQAPAYVAARSDLLAAVFSFAAIERALAARERGRFPIGAALFYSVALGSKESALVVVPALVLLEAILPAPPGASGGRARGAAQALLAAGVPLAAYLLARSHFLGAQAFPAKTLPGLLALGADAFEAVLRTIASKMRLLHFAAHPAVLPMPIRAVLEGGAAAAILLAALRARPVSLAKGAAMLVLFVLLLQGPGLQVHTDPRELSMTRQFYFPSLATAVAFGLLLAPRRALPLLAVRIGVGAVALLANQVPYVRAARTTQEMRDAVATVVQEHEVATVVLVDVPFNLAGVPFFIAPFGTPPAFAPPFAPRATLAHPLAAEAFLLLPETRPEIWGEIDDNLGVVRFHAEERRFTAHRVRTAAGSEWGMKPETTPPATAHRLDLDPLEPGGIRRLRILAEPPPAGGTVRWWRSGEEEPSGTASLARSGEALEALLGERIDWRLAGPIDRLEVSFETPARLRSLESVAAPDPIEVLSPGPGEEVATGEIPVFAFRSPYPGRHRVALVPDVEGVLARFDADRTEEGFRVRIGEGERRVWEIFVARMKEGEAGFRVEVVGLGSPTDLVAASALRRLRR